MGGLRQRFLWDAERSLGEISQSGVRRGPHVRTVWVSVWKTLSEGTSIAGCSSPYSKRRAQGFFAFSFLLFCWCPLCHLSPQVSSESSSPDCQHSPLNASEDRATHPGSESLLRLPLT